MWSRKNSSNPAKCSSPLTVLNHISLLVERKMWFFLTQSTILINNNKENFLPHKQPICRKYSLDLEYMKPYEAHNKHIQILLTYSKQVQLKQEHGQWKHKEPCEYSCPTSEYNAATSWNHHVFTEKYTGVLNISISSLA